MSSLDGQALNPVQASLWPSGGGTPCLRQCPEPHRGNVGHPSELPGGSAIVDVPALRRNLTDTKTRLQGKFRSGAQADFDQQLLESQVEDPLHGLGELIFRQPGQPADPQRRPTVLVKDYQGPDQLLDHSTRSSGTGQVARDLAQARDGAVRFPWSEFVGQTSARITAGQQVHFQLPTIPVPVDITSASWVG